MKIFAEVDVFLPLVRETSVKMDGVNTWVEFRYERCPDFCYNCGVIGHGDKSYSGEKREKQNNRERQFGTWMRAGNIMISPLRSWKGSNKEDNQCHVVTMKGSSVIETSAEKQYSQGSENKDGMRCKQSDKENKDKEQRKMEIERKWREILRENTEQKKEMEKGEK